MDILRGARLVLSIVVAIAGARSAAEAGCNAIPAAARQFPGAKGLLARPYAAPNEMLGVELFPCDTDAFNPDPAQSVVTVVFKPTASTERHLLVLTTDPCATIQGQLTACATGVVTAECRQIIPNTDIVVGTVNGRRRLSFKFPDTATTTFPGYAGPAAVAVTHKSQPIPCGLATTSCASQPGLLACADQFYEDYSTSSTCKPAQSSTYELDQFVALPAPNGFSAQCHDDQPPCTNTPSQLQLALDGFGNALIPVNWKSVMPPSSGVYMRLVRAALKWPISIDVPPNGYLGSYSPDGVRLPPIFDPLVDPTGLADVVRLFGTTDSPYSVLRVRRLGQTCNGGSNINRPCLTTADCPGGTCPTVCVGGPNDNGSCTASSTCAPAQCGQLFDLGSQPAMNVGPVPIAWAKPPYGCLDPPHKSCSTAANCSTAGNLCARYRLRALFAARYPALQTPDLNAYALPESADTRDLNGDGDVGDDVIVLQNRKTGEPNRIGLEAGPASTCAMTPKAWGRAVAMGHRGTFTYPLASVDGSYLAFLESEAGQKSCDLNHNGFSNDAILRVFKLGPVHLTAGTGTNLLNKLTADENEVVNGKSVVVSGGRVFFRRAGVNVLQVWDTALTTNPKVLCPATAAAVAGGLATFLTPETNQVFSGCPTGPMNNDGDISDTVVQLWTGGAVQNLERAATAVAMSPTWVAALISESMQGGPAPEVVCAGGPPGDRNCDGDTLDNVVAVHAVSGGSWINVGQAADAVDMAGEVTAFITPEAAQGQSLNGDSDTNDRVLQLYYASDPSVGLNGLFNVKQAAEEFVIGDPVECNDGVQRQFLAFRTNEAAQGTTLNGDTDLKDDVLQVIDVLHPNDGVFGPHQSVVPCTMAACDPRLPYRVTGRTVRYLTRECDEGGPETKGCKDSGTDLNRDGDASDTVVQVYDACVKGTPATAGALATGDKGAVLNQLVDPLLVQDGSQLFYTTLPGRCVPNDAGKSFEACGVGTVADLTLGTCVRPSPQACDRDSECGAGATCTEAVLPVAFDIADRDRDGIPDILLPSIRQQSMGAPPAPEPSCFCRTFSWLPCCRAAQR